MNLKNVLGVIAISAATAVSSVWGYNKLNQSHFTGMQNANNLPVNYAGFFDKDNAPGPGGAVDFTNASMAATPAVVHIKTRTKAKQVTNNQRQQNPFGDAFGGGSFFDDFFGGPRMQVIPEQKASGSGVVISDDGYIVTNNHVVDGADEINVTLTNKKTYKATVVGTDPSSDLAVIKVEASGLPFLVYGNSDEVKLGQWVLAIGYPLNLDVTVTAGIVSAKARSISINNRQSANPVESFIQTDAAVNRGNSGGALINTNGQLIGINSAIASETGSYAGYSYAIPVNIVKKIVNDIVKFGTVQRAFIGISMVPENSNDQQQKAYDDKYGNAWKTNEGIFVIGVPEGGAAASAGLKEKDIITKVNGVRVTSGPELQEQVTSYKPGDKVSITYLRDGKENTTNVILKNKAGNTDVVKTTGIMEKIGGDLTNLDKKTATANEIAGGVLVKKVGTGLLGKKTKMQDGFVIVSVNGQTVATLEDLKGVLNAAKGGTVRLEGIYPGYEGSYAYPLTLGDEE